MAVVDVTGDGLVVREMLESMTLADLQAATEPPLRLANDWRPLAAPAA
jgi:3-oxoadipate CoA-transferase beta subunit